MSNGLILRIRAEALWSSLDKLKNILATAPDRRVDLNTLERRFQAIREQLNAAMKSLSDVQVALRFKTADASTRESAESTYQNITEILREADEGISDIANMRNKCFRIQETEFGRDLGVDLKTRTEKPMIALEELQTRLADPETLPETEWPIFRQRLQCISEKIFAEYIEFLGGLALRDTGFDLQISQLAEEVIRTYGVGNKPSGMLAIPAHQQAMAVTLPRIIRVTYPDWSIWSLPSTALEFWRVVARADLSGALRSSLRQLTGPRDDVEPRFHECLGDAFATYTLGPAYAFYCVCLQLEPAAVYTSGRALPVVSTGWDCGEMPPPTAVTPKPDMYPGDGVRVHCILHMLELMDEKAPVIAPAYRDVRLTLSNAWEAAVQPFAAAATSQEKLSLEQEKERSAVLVRALWNTPAIKSSAPFTAQVWNEVQNWIRPLLDGKPESIKLLPGAELRHVLNAAWLARIQDAWKPELTDSVDRLALRIRNGGKN